MDEDGPESEESTFGALDTQILHKWSRVVPESEKTASFRSAKSGEESNAGRNKPESDGGVVRSSTGSEDDTKDNETSDGQNL